MQQRHPNQTKRLSKEDREDSNNMKCCSQTELLALSQKLRNCTNIKKHKKTAWPCSSSDGDNASPRYARAPAATSEAPFSARWAHEVRGAISKIVRNLANIFIWFHIYLVWSDIVTSSFFFKYPKKICPVTVIRPNHRSVSRLAGTLATATAAAFAGFAEQIQQLSGRQHSVNLEGSK